MELKTRRLTLATAVLITVAIVLTATTYAALGTNQNPSTKKAVELPAEQTSVPEIPDISENSSSQDVTPPIIFEQVSADIDVYLDCNCTINLSKIDWGNLSPGESTNKTIYIKNTGNSNLTLSMQTANWYPEGANELMTISWDQEKTTLAPENSTIATITLAVEECEIDFSAFAVQINITGTT